MENKDKKLLEEKAIEINDKMIALIKDQKYEEIAPLREERNKILDILKIG